MRVVNQGRAVSPAVACGKSLHMLLFLLQFLLNLYAAVEYRAVEILADYLIAQETLAIVTLCCHSALLFL